MTTLPLFSYPTAIAWVDDDELLLQAATSVLGKKIQIKTFNSPTNYLNYLLSYVPHLETLSFFQGQTQSEDYEAPNHLPIDINTPAFVTLPMQPERKNEMSVLIVDYNMPEMTGIELCRRLKNKPFKKILLTGEADNSHAVAAFNEGIIDCFLRKDSLTLAAEVKNYIHTLTYNYFVDQSKALLSHLEVDRKTPFSDPIFSAFFKEWCEKNDIEEHYIFDKQGNMQVINAQGKLSYFIVQTDNTLDQFCEVYGDCDEDTRHFISEVAERKKIPFFGIGQEPWQCAKKDWPQYFYTPERLEGREKYYWFAKL